MVEIHGETSSSAGPELTRRGFLSWTAGIGAGLVVGWYTDVAGVHAIFGATAPEGTTFEPSAYLTVESGGAIRFILHRSEMGQGVRTSLAMLLAEELRVDPAGVRVEKADGEPRFGDQNTDGSTTIRGNFDPIRRAGAAARAMLIAAAAEQWGVDASECRAEAGSVVHPDSARSATYGALAEAASKQTVPDAPELRDPAEWTIVGKPRGLIDQGDVACGRAQFGIDVVVPGMLHASLERCPTKRGKLGSFDATAAKAIPGVRHVVAIEPAQGLTNSAVAVVADNTWAALQGRRALSVQWEIEEGPHESTGTLKSALDSIVSKPQAVVRNEGDVEEAARGAARTIEAMYRGPHLAHSPMEPPCATAHVTADRCEIWAPTQHPMWARRAASELLGMQVDRVTVHVTLLGGGFGRKSKPDFVLEAVAIAKAVGSPVKLTWTREDEIRHGFYRAQNAQWLRGTLDDQGRITSWTHRTAFPSLMSTFDSRANRPSGGELSMGFANNPYRVPNLRLEAGGLISELRIGWLRSVCNTFHAHAVNSFMDELARAADKDPIEFHLEHLGEPGEPSSGYEFDRGRLRGVIERVRQESGWGATLPAGEGVGFAVHTSFLTYVAMIARVVVEGDDVRVLDVHAAVDCGRVVNPDTVRAQVEGSVAFALTYALRGAITVENGVVQESNFHDYPLLRIGEMPRVHVAIVDSDRLPSGMGEPAVPPVSAAVTNAIAAATGRRIRDLPIAGQSLSNG
ncbi:MAG: xanthine dehydrogenase family protein molybdopterin-binding subunit [Planctomycetes bacterium]|nr:xanthine dehydrogenase family protein molybdopterin-binding subunit [Planctomycetota bacterium]